MSLDCCVAVPQAARDNRDETRTAAILDNISSLLATTTYGTLDFECGDEWRSEAEDVVAGDW